MSTDPAPTDAEVRAAWDGIDRRVQALRTHFGTAGGPAPSEQSSLAEDDCLTQPFPMSDVLRICVNSGLDHLDAAVALMINGCGLHMAAPWTLARAALEQFAVACWLLHPPSRPERITRTLLWYRKENTESLNAANDVLPDYVPVLKARQEQIAAVLAKAKRLSPESTNFSYTGVVTYVDEQFGVVHPVLGVRYQWRLCSGFTHAQPWAHFAGLNVTQDEPNEFTLSNDPSRPIPAALAALTLAERYQALAMKRSSDGVA